VRDIMLWFLGVPICRDHCASPHGHSQLSPLQIGDPTHPPVSEEDGLRYLRAQAIPE
jgi:hypothetical protein